LELSDTRTWKGDIRSGRMVCANCGRIYPIAEGRPVLLTESMIDQWKAPIDEVLGISDPTIPPLSIPRLVEIGVDNALRRAEVSYPSDEDTKTPGEYRIDQSIRGKLRYRRSGKWFDAGTRRQRLLNFGGSLSESFDGFMKVVAETKPEVLLDMASGGGFGVSHQIYRNRTVKQVMAIERDVKCLGNIQYRFKCAGGNARAEAIGGDVRMLPLRTGSIDTVMMLQALPEISGISKMLGEVHRVLRPGRYFVIEVIEAPFTGGLISLEEFVRFAGATDLYAGYEELQKLGEEGGLKTVLSKSYARDGKSNVRLIKMKKC
ncbi:MAG: methyltransferase domain-containing protein, partial [Candidatus Aegiribacteria sp.]|nr:methyltransferase domain-containing protein [Candidatus Aegiribacteria sp.]MBD3294875.1 methyltransferase domain-containing protein [Candidatus Fermentibacteria bacterium]